jgi:polyphosphate glucokinase
MDTCDGGRFRGKRKGEADMAEEILGIDVGGSGIKGAPVNVQTGELTGERRRIKTPQPATPEAMTDTMAEIATHFNWKGKIGVGFPAVVKQGVMYTAANVDPSWIGTNGRAMIEAKTGCPVSIINDADAAGLAEMRFGAGKGKMGSVMMVTLGTGIGTGYYVDGRLVPNTELGHIMIRGKDAERRASAGVREKKEYSWEKWGKLLTEYLHELERLLWPDLFIIGGGVSDEFDTLAPHIEIQTPMVPARMLNLAGIVGAALAAEGEANRETGTSKATKVKATSIG